MTTFSINLETNAKLLGSRKAFYRNGVTTADLKDWRNEPSSSDLLIMFVKAGASDATSIFIKVVGSGSRSQLLVADKVMSLVTW